METLEGIANKGSMSLIQSCQFIRTFFHNYISSYIYINKVTNY